MGSLLDLTPEQRALAEAVALCTNELERRLLLSTLLASVLAMSPSARTLHVVRGGNHT